jgi:hypothetical protein
MNPKLNKKSSLACIVIPIYQTEFSENEKISFRQAICVFKQYDIFIICPTTLDINSTEFDKNTTNVIRFDDKYFKSTTSYSNLLIEPNFYKTFKSYKYMLIYQLDAYVFRDELAYWCNLNYDYIGAPWINDDWIVQFKKDIKDVTGLKVSNWLINRVGNGGFSLRKTRTFYYTSLIFGKLWYLWQRNEDFYWSNIFPKLNPFVKIPEVSIALRFAFDLDPQKCFELNNHEIPFGCHAWEKDRSNFYIELIEGLKDGNYSDNKWDKPHSTST